jgi:ribosome biogenesis GTPase
LPTGTIIKGIGGFYYVSSDDGIHECKARGIFRRKDLTPLTGDRVQFTVTDAIQKKGNIDEIQERSSLLVRPAVANVDQLIAVLAARSPEPDLLLLDKLLISAEKQNIGAVLCINKTDLDHEGCRNGLREAYGKAGYRVIETSSKENKGFDELDSALTGHISVFAGQSGVGKSTLLNRVMNTMAMKTGKLSDKLDRGKHTTRHAELMELSRGGYIVDTPGFSSYELTGIRYDELQNYYPEFADYIPECRFIGCSHINEPDCGVKNAVGLGAVSAGRYERYKELFAVLKQEDDMKYKKGNRKGTKS